MNRYRVPNVMSEFQGMHSNNQQQEMAFPNFNQMPFPVSHQGMIPTGMQSGIPTTMSMMPQSRPMMNPHQPHYPPSLYNSGFWPLGPYEQPVKGPESKARFSKDEVEQLEKVFQENNKPSGEQKREIAESLSVEVARINNWFQNRRAKKKQEDKARDNTASKSTEEKTPETQTPTVLELFPGKAGDQNNSAPLRPNAAAFPSPESSETPVAAETEVEVQAVSPTSTQVTQSPEYIEGLGVQNMNSMPSTYSHQSPKQTDLRIQSDLAARRNMNKVTPVRTSSGPGYNPGSKDYSRPRISDVSPISRSSNVASGRVQKKSSISNSHGLVSPTHFTMGSKFQMPVTPVSTQNGMYTTVDASVSPLAMNSTLETDMSPMAMPSYPVANSAMTMMNMPASTVTTSSLNMSTAAPTMALQTDNFFSSNPVTPSPSMSAGPFSGNTQFDFSSMNMDLNGFNFSPNMLVHGLSPSTSYPMDYSLSTGTGGLQEYTWSSMDLAQQQINVGTL